MNPQKKLKLLISSLKEKQMFSYFQCICEYNGNCPAIKNIKKKEQNNYIGTLQYLGMVASGDGKSYNQVVLECVTKILMKMVEDEKFYWMMKDCLKKICRVPESEAKKQRWTGVEKSIKTLPDYGKDPKQLKHSEIMNPMMSSSNNNSNIRSKGDLLLSKYSKTIKEQIFQSLNIENIHIKTQPQQEYYQGTALNSSHLMNKNSSNKNLIYRESVVANKENNQKEYAQKEYSKEYTHKQQKEYKEHKEQRERDSHTNGYQHNHPNQYDVTMLLKKVQDLECKLAKAENQNLYLNQRIKEIEQGQPQQVSCSKATASQKYSYLNPTYGMAAKEKKQYLKDISYTYLNTSNNSIIPEEVSIPAKPKNRSISLCSSVNPSTFNSKISTTKINIPKLNLEVLPNYHGKSNKSLNQVLLENYQKNNKK